MAVEVDIAKSDQIDGVRKPTIRRTGHVLAQLHEFLGAGVIDKVISGANIESAIEPVYPGLAILKVFQDLLKACAIRTRHSDAAGRFLRWGGECSNSLNDEPAVCIRVAETGPSQEGGIDRVNVGPLIGGNGRLRLRVLAEQVDQQEGHRQNGLGVLLANSDLFHSYLDQPWMPQVPTGLSLPDLAKLRSRHPADKYTARQIGDYGPPQ